MYIECHNTHKLIYLIYLGLHVTDIRCHLQGELLTCTAAHAFLSHRGICLEWLPIIQAVLQALSSLIIAVSVAGISLLPGKSFFLCLAWSADCPHLSWESGRCVCCNLAGLTFLHCTWWTMPRAVRLHHVLEDENRSTSVDLTALSHKCLASDLWLKPVLFDIIWSNLMCLPLVPLGVIWVCFPGRGRDAYKLHCSRMICESEKV